MCSCEGERWRYPHTDGLSSTESVHIVGLDGELKSKWLHDNTFSHDVESLGENFRWQVKVDTADVYSSALTLSSCFCPVYFEDTLLAVWRHGWQRRRQDFTEVLEEVTDHRKIYRLVQSDRYDRCSLTAVVFTSGRGRSFPRQRDILLFSLQDGCPGDASDRGPVGDVQPLRPGNCWELRHATVTPPCLLAQGIMGRNLHDY